LFPSEYTVAFVIMVLTSHKRYDETAAKERLATTIPAKVG
jgi:hypothetical protein